MVGTFATETNHKPDNVTSEVLKKKLISSQLPIIDIEHPVDLQIIVTEIF